MLNKNTVLENKLREDPAVQHVEVGGDGHHFEVTVVANVFQDMTRLARQRWVYAKIADLIGSGAVHAVQLYTWTESEWEKKNG